MELRRCVAGILTVFLLILWNPTLVHPGDVEDCANPTLIEADPARVLAACVRLAKEGYVLGQYALGDMYATGKGVQTDYSEAAFWYRKAADQGFAYAQYNLGYVYDIGRGVPQDYAEAAKWYRLAAEQGSAAAQNNLGTLYQSGQGVPQDYVQALMWFNLSAAQGTEKAAKNFDKLAAFMTVPDVAEAERLAREWLAKHQQE